MCTSGGGVGLRFKGSMDQNAQGDINNAQIEVVKLERDESDTVDNDVHFEISMA